VLEFEDPDHEKLAQAIAKRLGFTLVGQRLELFGRRTPVTPAPRAPRPDKIRG
jgi:Fur family ferric uptake transcriptional regulator